MQKAIIVTCNSEKAQQFRLGRVTRNTKSGIKFSGSPWKVLLLFAHFAPHTIPPVKRGGGRLSSESAAIICSFRPHTIPPVKRGGGSVAGRGRWAEKLGALVVVDVRHSINFSVASEYY